MKYFQAIRTALKWSGAALTIKLLVIWIASEWWEVTWAWTDDTFTSTQCCLSCGRVFAEHFVDGGVCHTFSSTGVPYPYWPGTLDSRPICCWWQIPVCNWKFSGEARSTGTGVTLSMWVPLWAPVLALGSSTIWIWRVDAASRRLKHGNFCPKCGYSRTGLASTTPCPECGIAPAAVRG
jgi:hypothetical protein